MLFHTPAFALFLAVVVAVVAVVRSTSGRKAVLLGASYFFYMWWSPIYVVPLLVTTFVDYAVGRLLEHEHSGPRRRALLVTSLIANLGLLGFFKYAGFFAHSTGALLHALGFEGSVPAMAFVLPVGISFYTFHTMSYTIDVYRREIPTCRSALDFALFITFFPVLIAGPIIRARQFLPQMERQIRLRLPPAVVLLILRGMVKKVLVADSVSPFVDEVFHDPSKWPSAIIWIATIGFAVQIYCDFSGYTDMARGLAQIFGFDIPLNFDHPYFARNPSDFWHRWHISLSTWLRDYLYIPLGGNRHGEAKTYRNLMVTMLLGGLWHGANWNFVLWGFLHGMLLSTHRLWARRRGGTRVETAAPWRRIVAWAACQYFVLLSWIAFRIRDPRLMLVAMKKFVFFDFDLHLLNLGIAAISFSTTVLILIAFAAVHAWSHFSGGIDRRLARMPLPLTAIVCATAGCLLALFWPSAEKPFIYFQF